MDASFTAFVVLSIVVIVTPGQDTALTIRNTIAGGRGAGIATALGVGAGQATWTLAASLGLTALLVASEPLFAAIRLLGAAYLVWLGLSSLWAAIRGAGHGVGGAALASLEPDRAFRQGTLSNLGNPKMAIFFSSLLPQFVTPGTPTFLAMLGLGLVFVGLTIAWLSGYAIVLARFRRVLGRARVRRTIDAVSGALLATFGVRLAIADR